MQPTSLELPDLNKPSDQRDVVAGFEASATSEVLPRLRSEAPLDASPVPDLVGTGEVDKLPGAVIELSGRQVAGNTIAKLGSSAFNGQVQGGL